MTLANFKLIRNPYFLLALKELCLFVSSEAIDELIEVFYLSPEELLAPLINLLLLFQFFLHCPDGLSS